MTVLKKCRYVFIAVSLVFLFVAVALMGQTTGKQEVENMKVKGLYDKNYPLVKSIYTFNITKFSRTENAFELILITTLQGLIAKKNDLQIYVYTTKDDYYIPTDEDKRAGLTTGLKFWLNRITKSADCPKIPIENGPKIPIKENESGDVWEAVKYFKDKIGIKGYVIYKPYHISQCLVTTVAGILNAIPVTPDNIEKVKNLGITKKLADISEIDLDSFYEQYDCKVSKDMAFELGNTEEYNVPNGPRDYAAMNNAVVYFPDPDPKNSRGTVLSKLTKPSPILGWNSVSGDEKNFVNDVSEKGHYVIPCDWGQNLSLLSSTGTAPQPAPDPMIKIDYDKSKKYVTFLISDGDNLQMWLNSANDERWWGNKYRGSKDVPVGWTIAPSMYSITPDVWNYYMKSAINNGKGNDEFVVAPSGMGYTFGGIAKNKEVFDKYLGYLNTFMKKTNISTVSIFGCGDWNNGGDWNNKEGDRRKNIKKGPVIK